MTGRGASIACSTAIVGTTVILTAMVLAVRKSGDPNLPFEPSYRFTDPGVYMFPSLLETGTFGADTFGVDTIELLSGVRIDNCQVLKAQWDHVRYKLRSGRVMSLSGSKIHAIRSGSRETFRSSVGKGWEFS